MSTGFGTKTNTSPAPTSRRDQKSKTKEKSHRVTTSTFLILLSALIVGGALYLLITDTISLPIIMFGMFVYIMVLAMFEQAKK